MCPKQPRESSLLPDCSIANRVVLFTLLQSLQEQERRMEEVHVQLRDRYEVFRQVQANYPVPVEGVYYEEDALAVASDSSGNETSDSDQIPVASSRITNRVN